ncbi:CDP-alcohol phosphatidyltransferase-like enzyme [Dokdonia sp. Hel_I_63]|uniref:CDP-alcohol phosphatidyltransferase family protein n=1 Tax=Dokdonia sp. Hel_I_63 TaxID=1249996 RepID=UPI00119ACA89|nr:CDP-alcohol phosphatidyltransferase family protein [Dokdonia sp. Hel_I_63]TVZ22921.1 CDP-alcohol phosphatidyltransferase-like enzyme [Dokdonia sp. Hel_I_63]
MSKLPKAHKFVDLSDYGRSIARLIALSLKNTATTPVQVTYSFVVSGIIAIICIIKGYYFLAAFFLILKSILDAADGELARIKKTPSYTGRYLDSISDILLNAAILYTIGYITNTDLYWTVCAFLCIQLQGTLYNYYYVILRSKLYGDTTSRVIEIGIPKALPGEQQSTVTFLYKTYRVLYGAFDALIYKLDPKAEKGSITPNWLMTIVSTFGLGFQLLLIAFFLVVGLADYIIPFFIGYSIMIPILIITRMIVTREV